MVDGELGRGKDYGDSHPNLVRVNEPALSLTLAAYALNPTLKLKNWDSMQGDRWRVEYQRGMQMPSTRLASVVPASLQSTISSPRLGLRKLAAGRTDIYIDFAEHIDPLLKSEPFTFSELVVKVGNMERVAIHAYLNRRHAALEPKLSAVLRDMKTEGLIKAYTQQAHHSSKAD
ncbi:hypothetical protein GTP45_00910 [Pseudoduganella sp. FT55W]|uniref:Transporter substrate-binding domain-containing protein n=1 Tax=Duganella rivi TaxID=2666083 RepID=A0A7X4K9Z2_9BURK|nr:hypothetical protein [Duganella rivi]MYM65392.1 hypothetical protein [Duganella rivi]